MNIPTLLEHVTPGYTMPLTESESEFMAKLIGTENEQLPLLMTASGIEDISVAADAPPPPLVEMFLTRLKMFAPDELFSLDTVAWCSSLCKRPAEVTLWAYTLIKEGRRQGTPIRISDWARMCPYGKPTEDRLKQVWNSQKAPGFPRGNRLDDEVAYKPESTMN